MWSHLIDFVNNKIRKSPDVVGMCFERKGWRKRLHWILINTGGVQTPLAIWENGKIDNQDKF